MKSGTLKIGTCSWNYDSWVGLVYSEARPSAADYLAEYAEHFETAEIDSWFYRIPSVPDVLSYDAAVPPGFRFTCKVPQTVTLTHKRQAKKSAVLEPNSRFLSVDHFNSFLEAADALLPRMDAIMFEFEYLNKNKMPSLAEFLDRLDRFFTAAPRGLPYALEPRNGNYLTEEYFSFLKAHNLFHVFSEKQYMPHVYDVYGRFEDYIEGAAVVRLLGGDRLEMEKKSGDRWDRIIEEKPDKPLVAQMLNKMLKKNNVTLNVNNHYEGSSPLTAAEFRKLLSLP
ncbi:MAG: DUF72 domain-containing protein [Spirochaetales bacterium]|nr:MAG: DUF72 domain-containing protein [Spirochaetales bacterium]